MLQFITEIPEKVFGLWQEPVQFCTFRRTERRGWGGLPDDQMREQLHQAQGSKRAPPNPGPVPGQRRLRPSEWQVTQGERELGMKFPEAEPSPKRVCPPSFKGQSFSGQPLHPRPYLPSEGLTICLLRKPLQAEADVTLPHGLWKSQKDHTDQITNSFSLTIILHLFSEGKTALKKSLNYSG